MATFISCLDLKERKLKHFEVPESVYVYIKQLELAIKYPEVSELKKVYKFRFQKDPTDFS